MKLFKSKTLERLKSLEDHIGAIFVIKDDYVEHISDTTTYGNSLESRVRNIEQIIRESPKGKK